MSADSRDPPAGGDAATEAEARRHLSRLTHFDAIVESFADLLGVNKSQAATIATLRQALQTIQQWDCLNPPRPDLLSDLPWLRRVVDAALADEEPKA